MFEFHDIQLVQYNNNSANDQCLLLEMQEQEQQMHLINNSSNHSKKMKLHSRINESENRVRFQEQDENSIHHYEPLPLHEDAEETGLWYCHDELKAIHKEIFVSLVESKNGSLSDFEFSARGLEEIRKRKPHKRQMRRKEYIANVVALSREQRRALGGEGHPEELQEFAVAQSRSASLRAQHYATLDAEDARVVYQETFQPRTSSPLKSENTAPRRMARTAPPSLSTSLARTA